MYFYYIICVLVDKVILTLPSDKVKENCEINLKVHCVMQLSLSYKVFTYVDGIS